MSYEDLELSVDQGRPLRLYEFTLETQGVPVVWRYTNADQTVQHNGFTWLSKAISDDGVKITGESTTDGLTITAPSNIGPVQQYIGTPPGRSMRVAIFSKHDTDIETLAIYAGEVAQVGNSKPGTSVITCQTLSADMQREGLRYGWQRTCPYAVYDELTCKVNKDDYAVNATVLSIVGDVVTCSAAVDAEDDGYFDGGIVEWTDPIRGTEFAAVESHAGPALTIFGTTDLFYVGQILKVYPGCDRTAAMCTDRFANLDNNGAYLHMPGKSPFDGSPVF